MKYKKWCNFENDDIEKALCRSTVNHQSYFHAVYLKKEQ